MVTRRSTRRKNTAVVEREDESQNEADTDSHTASPRRHKARNTTQNAHSQPSGSPILNEDGEDEEDVDEPPPLSPAYADENEEDSADDDFVADTTATPLRRRTKKPLAIADKAPDTYLSIITGDTEVNSTYSGLLDKLYKGKTLLRQLYGADMTGQTLSAWADSWQDWGLLPVAGIVDYGIFHDVEQVKRQSQSTRRRDSASCLDGVPGHGRSKYQFEEDEITCFIGDFRDPCEVKMKPGGAVACSQHDGMVHAEDSAQDAAVTGWLFDAGGIVLDMAWQPQQVVPSEGTLNPQYIALAVIPRHDHDMYDYEAEASKPDFEKYGTVQLWELQGKKKTTGQDTVVPHESKLPTLKRTLCIDRGRARRVEWSPDGQVLAILSGYGEIIVVHPWKDTPPVEDTDRESTWDFVKAPLATLTLKNEPYNKATAMTWVSPNQIAGGYTDGSICLWSIDPAVMLVRHPTHHCDVLSLTSARPNHPTLLASYPIGGNAKLIDINCPDYETTEAFAPMIATQPHLLAYSPHLQGFFMTMVSSHPLNDIIAFAPSDNFPVQKRVFQGGSLPTAIGLGVTHPFMLIGTMDGSLWALNQVHSLFCPKGANADRIRLLQHEHRRSRMTEPVLSTQPDSRPRRKRGAARIVMGFEPDKVPVLTLSKGKTKAPGRKAASRKKRKGQAVVGVDVDPEDGDDDGTGRYQERAVVHEPETRVTAVEWNPNGAFGTWAAVSFGNGLVRVLDLGLEREEATGNGD